MGRREMMKRIKAVMPRRNGTRNLGGHKAAAGMSRTSRSRDETGATLILALVFLVVIGTITAGIASWTANDLGNTLVFQQARNEQSALSSATNVAIQSIRYNPLIGTSTSNPETLNANPPTYCWGSVSPSQVTTQGQAVDVWCSTVWNPTSAATRVVTISACLASLDQGSGATCAQNPGLQTIVTFDDYSASSPNITTSPCSPPPGTCGVGMTISSSLIKVTSPTVTNLSSTSGPATGGGTLTLTGSGFVTGSTSVSLVSTTATQNLVLNGTNVAVSSSTSLTVTIPAATTVTSYNVVVTTPNGSSASSAATQYTYNPVIPTVTGVTTPSGSATGSAAGGSTVTITGTGFLTNNLFGDTTTVEFVDTQNAANVYTAPTNAVTVNSTGTQVTAVTPAISSTDLTYYVVVVTAPVGDPSAYGPTFTYQPLLPLVASVFMTQGGPNTQVTVTGVGFVTGATTVQLVPTSGSGTLTLTGVTVTGSTTLTGTVPSGGTVNRAYYVEATTPSGSSGSSGAPQFTYT